MNIITRKLTEWGVQNVLTKLFDAVKGKKTYIIASVGVIVALVGHFFGPINITPSLSIPAFGWGDVWNIVWNGGLFAALRHGATQE